MRLVEGVRDERPAPLEFPMPGRRVGKGHRIVALDGADEDGGTLYVLYTSGGEMRAASAWPWVLEWISDHRLYLVAEP